MVRSERAESGGSQHTDHFLHLECQRDREGSVHTNHIARSRRRNDGDESHEVMQRKIDHLRRKLRRARRKRSPSSSPSITDDSYDDNEDASYRPRSKTPPSESFSYEEEHHCDRRSRDTYSRGTGSDAMTKALNQISRSPFTRSIEGGSLPRRFTQPTFTTYNGRTDPVEHVSHFNQKMAVHSRNETLMCKVYPSSLGPMAMRWFDGLAANSIGSFRALTRAFCSRFVTNTRVPRPLDSLLSMSMREGETLKTYSDRYWEMFNEIEGSFDDVAVRTFKVGLPAEHDLRKSLTKKPVRSVRRLMDRIDEYKRVEEDQLLGKGKAKVIPQERRDFRSDRYNNNRLRRDYSMQSGSAISQAVHAVFREPIHQILEKIQNEPYFKWPNKMGGDSMKRNQSLHCQYHQERGHTTEDCRTLKSHLEQLAREGSTLR